MTSREAIARFMEYHVWAVWDFMSLLKALQTKLTCTTIPWMPIGDAETRFLINEIVVGEESDVDRRGIRRSHFEMYLNAMQETGADTAKITEFLDLLRAGCSVDEALERVEAPQAARTFVAFTMQIVESGKPHEIASVFTYGREEIIPTMFLGILDTLEARGESHMDDFRYYLERHVEVDGGHHGPLAERMVEQLIAGDEAKLHDAMAAARNALRHRVALWDGAAAACSIA